MERKKEIQKITLWGAAINILLTVGKIAAGILGRSAAMVADGIHSLSDLLSDVVVIVFTHVSSQGKDRKHAFGHGKFETLSTLIICIILIVAGAKLMSSGVENIVGALKGEAIPQPGYIALIAALVSIVFKEVLYHVTVRVGKKTNSSAVIANAWHHRSDAFSSVAAFVGIGASILLGDKWTILDPIVSCIISIAIIVVSIKMALPSLEELLETALPEEVEQEITQTISSVEGVLDIHNLKTRRNGISFIIAAHVVVDSNISVVQAHDIATHVENRLTEKYGPETQISIHIEPNNHIA